MIRWRGRGRLNTQGESKARLLLAIAGASASVSLPGRVFGVHRAIIEVSILWYIKAFLPMRLTLTSFLRNSDDIFASASHFNGEHAPFSTMSGCFSLLPIRTFDKLEVRAYDVVVVVVIAWCMRAYPSM